MIGSFEFNGIESSTFDLVCKSVKRPLFPAMRPRVLEVQGQSGVYDFGDNDYATRPITMHLAYKGDSYVELRTRAREIAAWLYTTTWAKLIINDEPDKYYLARVSGEIDLATLRRFGEADIIFECQPFAYMVIDTGDDLTWATAEFPWITEIGWGMADDYTFTTTAAKDFTFNNPGTQDISYRSPQGSKFDIVVTGSFSTLSLTLNGKTLNYTEAVASGTLTIDNVNMEVDLGGTNKLSKVTGDYATFLKIIPGANVLSVSGTDLNIAVVVDFAPIWI